MMFVFACVSAPLTVAVAPVLVAGVWERPNTGSKLMAKSLSLFCNGEPIGRTLTREEFVEWAKRDPGEVYDQLMDFDRFERVVILDEDGKLAVWNDYDIDQDADGNFISDPGVAEQIHKEFLRQFPEQVEELVKH
jgi:hypothetical protein